MKYLSFRNIFSAIALTLMIAIIGKWIAHDQHYHTVCLSGFSEELNRQGIAQSYWERGHIVIDPNDVLIEDVSPYRDGLKSYRYKTTDGLYSGSAIGHKCGVYDVLPGDGDALRREKFGGKNAVGEPKTQAFQL